MPIFEYRCESCGETSEFIEGVNGLEQPVLCLLCSSPKMVRLLPRGVGTMKKTAPGAGTCCGRPERCDEPPCATGERCPR